MKNWLYSENPLDIDDNTKIIYTIVGEDESDSSKNKISFNSPIAKGLIGKNKNDFVEINTPAGVKNFEIKNVKYI